MTAWNIAGKDSQWFSPSKSALIINYRVDDLGEMMAQLRGGVWNHPGPRSAREREVRVDHGPRGKQGRALGAEAWDEKNKGG